MHLNGAVRRVVSRSTPSETAMFLGLSTKQSGRLPKFTPSPTYDSRFTLDRFGVAVACPPDAVDSVSSVLSTAGAEEVRR